MLRLALHSSATALLAAALLAQSSLPVTHEDAPVSTTRPTTTQSAHTNRLIHASSPYLLQHAHNPVDWYEWGTDALERARREDKPIFLSIGYSACHWCHVMAHESFENPDIAALMNRCFVNIKVDREERPDLDELYMQATLAYTGGQGGWPMSVWLTPDLKPFAAGTYFPPVARWGHPGFADICSEIDNVWRTRRHDVESDADRLTQYLQKTLTGGGPPADALTLTDVDQTANLLATAFDPAEGGLRSAGPNKFPPSLALDVMLRVAHRHHADHRQRDRFLGPVQLTLDKMAAGGIHDQLGGGFHRYSTDPHWLVPHFEKMLYDQALLARIYLDAYQLTRNPSYAAMTRDICDYVLADLQAPAGGFYSARDADSEGREGKFYVWSRSEIVALLGPHDGELFCSAYDVSDSGNWQDPHAPAGDPPTNILHLPRSLDVVAKLNHVELPELERRLAAARARLLAVRAKRVSPHRDDKILAEWNGMMIASLVRAGSTLDEPRYLDAARRAADFILTNQYRDGRLLRSYRDGQTLPTAFLTDYAWMIEGLLELFEATFETRWLNHAAALNAVLSAHYWDDSAGGYFLTAADHEQLLARTKDVRDGATPSGNSVQLMNLLRLAALLDDANLRAKAEQMLSAFAGQVRGQPGTGERFLCAVDFARTGPLELAVIGNPRDEATRALLQVIRQTYLPNRAIALKDPTQPDAAPDIPLLRGRDLVAGRPAAYVCRNYVCQQPATTPEELRAQLRN